ncbi:hypothetical protein GOP47_0030369 [Adiantum capillus-veneris]|nr:hypothetical protein GOP47_0030369 [Adiantum capillus-veneris]
MYLKALSPTLAYTRENMTMSPFCLHTPQALAKQKTSIPLLSTSVKHAFLLLNELLSQKTSACFCPPLNRVGTATSFAFLNPHDAPHSIASVKKKTIALTT